MTDAPAARARPPAPVGAPAPAHAHEVVYEDEHVLMEWSVRTPATDTIAVTFDPILVDPSQPSYAAAFLHKTGIDTLCVRKKSEHFYQPLTRERFEQAANPVLAHYRHRLAYGSSLGAYAVLYFCAHGFETVISSSPRVSAHPRFGRPHWQERAPFTHTFFDPAQPATSGAVVFYDPHDAMDRHFVEEGLRPAWPRAQFVAVPYAGHPANQFLSEIGYISPFVQAIARGRAPPALDRRGTKAHSFTYRHMLAAACLRHGKPHWAERLCRQALEMKPDLVAIKLTLGQALLALGQLDKAESALADFLQKYPQDGDARLALRTLARERARLERKRVLPAAGEQLRRLGSEVRGASTAWRGRPGMAALWLTGRLRLTVTREDIEWCYRYLLGRRPESVHALVAHRRCPSFEKLVRAFVSSPEYARAATPVPFESTLERVVRTATLVRRLLPAGGRMTDVWSAGFFSAVACERLGGPQATAEAAPMASPPDDAAAGENAARFHFALNTAPVVLAAPEGRHVVHSLALVLQPGGHALLATRAARDDERHAAYRQPGAADAAASLLQAHGFEVIETFTVDGEDGTLLTLARKP